MTTPSGGLALRPGVARLALGLGQGALLYAMFQAAEHKMWPATNLALFQAVALPLFFTPLAAIHGLSHLPRRTLVAWLTIITLLCALVGFCDGYRFPGALDQETWDSAPMVLATAAGLFLAEALLLAAHADGRGLARYATIFDAISKHAVQVASAIVFVGALWALLLLGGALFKLIKLTFLYDLIRESWFAIPATSLAVSIAIHVTDVRQTLVRGLRTLAHSLLSWLMPLLALIVGGFLLSLPFTGLQPLWDTRFAAGLLLGVVAALIILINAVYQDGTEETRPRGLMRWAMTVTLALPAPLIGIAAYAIFLRVAQYGWTSERVVALACVLVGACFGFGYWTALVRGMKSVETTNVVACFVTIAVLFALLTPVADPVRISVASQVARLEAGKVSAEMFDYKYLRFEGGRYGVAALGRMTAREIKVAGVAERAAQAAKLTAKFGETPVDEAGVALNIRVEGGRTLPESFLAQDWASITQEKHDYPNCLHFQAQTCEAFLRDLDADGNDEIILAPDIAENPPMVFAREQARWVLSGALPSRIGCEDTRSLLRSGDIKTVPSRWPDLEINGQRVDIAYRIDSNVPACPQSE
jgi:hypothetical protein